MLVLHHITQKQKYQDYVCQQATLVFFLKWSYVNASSGLFPPAQTRSAVSLSAIGRTMHSRVFLKGHFVKKKCSPHHVTGGYLERSYPEGEADQTSLGGRH